jgi:hypothetical protein
MMAVMRWRRVGGWSGRSALLEYLARLGAPLPRGGVCTVIPIAVMAAGSRGRLSSFS